MEGLLVIWLGIAGLTAIAASARNRSGFGWFCIGLLTGLFGLIAVLVMRPGEDASTQAWPSGSGSSGDFARMGQSGGQPKGQPIDGLDLGIFHGYQMVQRPDGVYAAGVRHASAAEARTYILAEIGRA